MTTPDHGKNDDRFDVLEAAARKFGSAAAKGSDALPQLAVAVATAAYNGVIDEEKTHDMGGELVDAATIIYSAYKKGSGNKQFSDYSGGGDKANISKVRAFVKLGLDPHAEGPELLTKVSPAIDTCKKAGAKVLSPYPAMLNVARLALNVSKDEQRALTEDEILEAVQPAQKDDPSLTDYLKSIEKRLEKLISGENSAGLKCQDDRVVTAYEKIREMTAFLVQGEELAQLMARAAEMGLNVTPAHSPAPVATDDTEEVPAIAAE